MNPKSDPAQNMELHAQAERAALAAYLASAAEPGNRRMQLMDQAARKVFKAAGTPPDMRELYAEAVTCLVLERMHYGAASPQPK